MKLEILNINQKFHTFHICNLYNLQTDTWSEESHSFVQVEVKIKKKLISIIFYILRQFDSRRSHIYSYKRSLIGTSWVSLPRNYLLTYRYIC